MAHVMADRLPRFATLLIQDGQPLADLKEQLGHSSIKMTVDVYGAPRAGGQPVKRSTDFRS